MNIEEIDVEKYKAKLLELPKTRYEKDMDTVTHWEEFIDSIIQPTTFLPFIRYVRDYAAQQIRIHGNIQTMHDIVFSVDSFFETLNEFIALPDSMPDYVLDEMGDRIKREHQELSEFLKECMSFIFPREI